MTKSDKDAAEHGRYGDTPLGKSDEELRAEGAEALTEDERRAPADGVAEGIVPIPLASAGGGVPGTALPAVGAGLLVTGDLALDGSDEARREDE